MPLSCLHIEECLASFALAVTTQGGEQIKPFHQYVGIRMVIEGGFHPDEITPHPPLRAIRKPKKWLLESDADAATTGEMTVLGGMKSKVVDVVVEKKGVGPVVAVSVKGTTKAYRNLVNRMEEAIGDSTNLHVMYPGLVYGFIHLLRANREGTVPDRDTGVDKNGQVVSGIRRYYEALSEMTGRRFVRNDFTRYESVGLALVESHGPDCGKIVEGWPPEDSPLHIDSFFERLYQVYELRFPLRADTVTQLRRHEWSPDSPLFVELAQDSDSSVETVLGYLPRLAG